MHLNSPGVALLLLKILSTDDTRIVNATKNVHGPSQQGNFIKSHKKLGCIVRMKKAMLAKIKYIVNMCIIQTNLKIKNHALVQRSY